MAGYGADLDETPRWRLSILFLVVVVLSLVGHVGLHKLEEYFRKHKRMGLKHTLQSLKDELFALGLITLLLIVLQDQIVKICIDGDSDSDDSYDKPYPAGNRKMLAGTGGDFKCPSGQESFWSLTALHEIHILIFLIAIVHLAQAAFSMILASLRVRRWKKYEDRSRHDMVPLKRKRAIKPKGSWAALWIYSFFTQFSDSVDGPVYLAIRRFFLEKMELDDDFNFYKFVMDSMEEDFAKLVEFQWIMWLIAAIYILLPWQAYAVIWLPCCFLVIMLIVGAKLQSVAIQIATLAYTHYTPNFIPHRDRKPHKGLLTKGTSKIKSMLGKAGSQPNLAQLAKQQKGRNSQDSIDGNSSRELSHQKSRKNIEMTGPPSLGNVSRVPQDLEGGPPELGNVSRLPYEGPKDLEAGYGPSHHYLSKYQEKATDTSSGSSDTIERAAYEKGKLEKNKSKIAEYMAQTRLLTDSSSLFWFSKPKIMMHIFQYVYFQSGLSISLLILDEWRGQQINHLTGQVVYVLMIGLNLIVMIHAALFVIPTYAMTVAAGAYGPDNVLRKALKRNVNPRLAKRLDLERKSFTSVGSDDGSIETDGEGGGGGVHDDGHHGHVGHGDDARINTLLEAMDHSQTRKKKLEETEAKFAEEGIGHYFKSAAKLEPIAQNESDEAAVVVPVHH